MFRLLAAILFLGNVEFVAPQNNKDKSSVKNKDVVQKVANLLKVKPGEVSNYFSLFCSVAKQRSWTRL
jgi:myosin heavy subunit